ncbi:MAG: tRNA preQ1(34) S-adenosylmethionine ribosyltransferase-isomerase QueA [Thermodesulfobacteriota bacterium]
MKTEEFSYSLPSHLVAQVPSKERDKSRLLILERSTARLTHTFFNKIEDYLGPEDVLVVNDTKVMPARLLCTKESGGRAQLLYLGNGHGQEASIIRCLIKGSKIRAGTRFRFASGGSAQVVSKRSNGVCLVRLDKAVEIGKLLQAEGLMPLPPYIMREGRDGFDELDRERYQTIFAAREGAVAAPTAGLHLTDRLIDRLKARGILIVKVTLHVSYGSFFPIRAEEVEEHALGKEWFEVSKEAARVINSAKQAGKRVVATGTTTVRTLESAADPSGHIFAQAGQTDLYIYPGYQFKVVDALITNFHLPRSSLLVLVCAFAGRQLIFEAYHEAIGHSYRFYSYGDAMFIH